VEVLISHFIKRRQTKDRIFVSGYDELEGNNMTVFTKTGQLARRLIRGLIHRLWIKPLETGIIPRLDKEKSGDLQRLLLRMSL
jgi:hypothetical protein